MFCKYCGARIADDENFCGACGAEIERRTPEGVSEPRQCGQEPHKAGANRCAAAGFALAVVCVAVTAAFLCGLLRSIEPILGVIIIFGAMLALSVTALALSIYGKTRAKALGCNALSVTGIPMASVTLALYLPMFTFLAAMYVVVT